VLDLVAHDADQFLAVPRLFCALQDVDVVGE